MFLLKYMAIATGTIFRKLSIFIRRRLGPTVLPSGDGSLYWRERIFHYFSLAIISVGLVVYVYYGLTFLENGNYPYAIFATFVFLSALFASSVRSLPFEFRVSWIIFLIFLIGVYSLYEAFITPMGYVLLFSYTILSGILQGHKKAVRTIFINAFTLLVLGFAYYSVMFDLPEPSVSLRMYINISISFIVVNVVTLFPLISLLNGLVFSLEKERRLRKLLRREHEDLALAKRKAEESDMLKTAFLSNMSHEIRTPMNAILGFSNLLSHPDINQEEKEEFVNLIKINGKNLLTLVEDIIDISKIDSGQLEIKNAPCRLHDMLMGIYDSFFDDIKRRGLTSLKLYLKEGASDENLEILTDEHRLRQIFVNLVGNAIKFTDRGFVEFGYTLQDSQFVKFFVKDTGIGLPKGKEAEIFERFSKYNNDKERLYGGTGIGLSIVKHLVELMGGEIWVESEPLVGTIFYFTLPFHKIESKQLKKKKAGKKKYVYNWEGKTFLVAEDEEDNFRYIEVALSLSNASLIWARDGKEAVEIFKKIDNIDLVLMDIKMPLLDGYSATREIKKINKSVPVIAQTAYALSEEKDKSLAAGCDDYIAKPISYEDLLSTIHKFVPGNSEEE
jgi:signal transduction histidine kinase/CheY-like chemotaxis protein